MSTFEHETELKRVLSNFLKYFKKYDNKFMPSEVRQLFIDARKALEKD